MKWIDRNIPNEGTILIHCTRFSKDPLSILLLPPSQSSLELSIIVSSYNSFLFIIISVSFLFGFCSKGSAVRLNW